MGIFEGRTARASMTLWLGAAAACGRGTTPAQESAPKPTAERTVAMTDVYLAGRSGPPPADTAAALVSGTPRHVLLRTPDPDNMILADVYFGAGAFQAPAGTAVHVTLRPAPAGLGLIIETDSPFAAGGQITFKYAVHLVVPADAAPKYANHLLFERALAIGRSSANGQITLLASTHPASDNLQALAAQPGTYLVAAPR